MSELKLARDLKAKCEQERLLDAVPSSFRKTVREKLPQPKKMDEAMRWSFGSGSLLLYGPTGCGKSRIAWEVAKREIASGRKVVGVGAFQLVRYPALFLSGNDEAGKFADKLCDCELLLLDDPFKAKPTERVEELLFAVLDERNAWERPTIITVNDSQDSLGQRLTPDRGPAVIRRLRENCMVVSFA